MELGKLDFVIERMWVAEPIQGRRPVIKVGTLTDGRWWASRDDGHRWAGAWVFGDEVQAEAAADRWSRRSGLRWLPAAVSGD